jgi:hypothetical protein
MSAKADWLAELHDLIDRLQDGELGEADRARLNELLAAGVEQRRYFIAYMDVHSRLAWEGGRREDGACGMLRDELPTTATAAGGSAPIHHSSFIVHRLPLPGPFVSYCLAAVLLSGAVLGAWLWKPAGRENRPPEIVGQMPVEDANASPPLAIVEPKTPLVATVTGTLGCQWAHPDKVASDAKAGRMAIAAGLVEVTYNTGVKVVLQGPAEFQLEWPNGGVLIQGKVVVRIEKKRKPSASNEKNSPARGDPEVPTVPLFAIRTPNAMMTYTGSRDGQFEVSVDKSGGSLTRVVRGTVALGLRTWWPSPDGVVIEQDESALVDFQDNPAGNVLIFGGKERPQIYTHDLPRGSPVFSRRAQPLPPPGS